MRLFSFDAKPGFAELCCRNIGGGGAKQSLELGASVELQGRVEDSFVADFDSADEIGAEFVDIEVEGGEPVLRERSEIEIGDDALIVYDIDDFSGLVVEVKAETDVHLFIHDPAKETGGGAVVAELDVEGEFGEVGGDVD